MHSYAIHVDEEVTGESETVRELRRDRDPAYRPLGDNDLPCGVRELFQS